MKSYFIIDSRGAFESAATPSMFALAQDLAAQGNKVEIFLVQNGVMQARAGAKADALAGAIGRGIGVLADDFSLKERALTHHQLSRGVKPAPIGTVIDRMENGWNVIWH